MNEDYVNELMSSSVFITVSIIQSCLVMKVRVRSCLRYFEKISMHYFSLIENWVIDLIFVTMQASQQNVTQQILGRINCFSLVDVQLHYLLP